MRPALIFCALALAACAPPAEPRDASADRRVSRPDSAPDVEEPFEDVFFPTSDAPSAIDSAPDAEFDATAPDSSSPTPDAQPDSAPDARDAGSVDVFRVCPAAGGQSFETVPCRDRCCPNWEMCVVDGEQTRCEVRVCPLYPAYPTRTLRCNHDCCDPATEECVSDAAGFHCRRRSCPSDPRTPTATQRCGRQCCEPFQTCNPGGTYPVSPMGERFCG